MKVRGGGENEERGDNGILSEGFWFYCQEVGDAIGDAICIIW